MKRKKLAILSIAALSTLAYTASADWKTLPGSICQGYALESGFSYTFQGLLNPTSSSKPAMCPLVRDATNQTNIKVSVEGGEHMSAYCYLFSAEPERGYLYTTIPRESTSGNTSYYRLTQTIAGTRDTSHAVYCSVPAQSTLKSIYYVE